MKEVKFDWAKFSWIGSPERTVRIIYGRTDTPYKSLEDIRNAAEQPRCGATALGTVGHYFPRLIEEVAGVKFSYRYRLSRRRRNRPGHAKGRSAVPRRQSGRIFRQRADARLVRRAASPACWCTAVRSATRVLPDVPTVNEILDKRKASDVTRRLAVVLMAPDSIGRPLIAPPGMPADRLTMLREALIKALDDPEFKAEAQKRNWEIEPVTGQELEAIAKKVVVQPPDVVERMKKVLAQ